MNNYQFGFKMEEEDNIPGKSSELCMDMPNEM